MGHEFYPEGLSHVIRRVAKDWQGDIIVTENGVAAEDDAQRVRFIRRALEGVEDCVAQGIPVKGYLHWTLLGGWKDCRLPHDYQISKPRLPHQGERGLDPGRGGFLQEGAGNGAGGRRKALLAGI